jgi:hypothetical protein
MARVPMELGVLTHLAPLSFAEYLIRFFAKRKIRCERRLTLSRQMQPVGKR